MAPKIDPFRGFVRDTLVVRHRLVGERHASQWFDFTSLSMRRPDSFFRDIAAHIPRDWRRAITALVVPEAATDLGERLATMLEVEVVHLKSLEFDCDLATPIQHSFLKGRDCLIADVCVETGATLAASAATVRLYGGNVLGALVVVEICSRTNGRHIPHLPVGAEVVSCTEVFIDCFTPDKCPTCTRGGT